MNVPSRDLAKARTEVSQLLWGLGPKAGFSSHAEVTVVLRMQSSQSGGLRRMEQFCFDLKWKQDKMVPFFCKSQGL